MLCLGFDHALVQCTTSGLSKRQRKIKRTAATAATAAKKAAAATAVAEAAAAETQRQQAQSEKHDAVRLSACEPLKVLAKFVQRSGLPAADLAAIKPAACAELDPRDYFLWNTGSLPFVHRSGALPEDSPWQSPRGGETLLEMVDVGAPDPSTDATRRGCYLYSRAGAAGAAVCLTKVDSPEIDLFSYMWLYAGDGVFYRSASSFVSGEPVMIKAGAMPAKSDADESFLKDRMCYFRLEL